MYNFEGRLITLAAATAILDADDKAGGLAAARVLCPYTGVEIPKGIPATKKPYGTHWDYCIVRLEMAKEDPYEYQAISEEAVAERGQAMFDLAVWAAEVTQSG